MATQAHLDTTEDRLELWQKEAGWWDSVRNAPSRMPFAVSGHPTVPLTKAEDEQEEILGTQFIESVVEAGWPNEAISNASSEFLPESGDDVGDLEHLLEETHAFLFARSGEGKTASRIRVKLEAARRGYLIIEYLDVGQEQRNYQEHAMVICERIKEQVPNEDLALMASSVQSQNLKPIQELKLLTKRIVPDYRKGIYILVENIEDNLGPDWEDNDVEDCVKPLLDPQLLGIAGLRFKFFLPSKIAHRARDYAVVTSRKFPLRVLRIRWTEARLRRCLEDRLRDVVPYEHLLLSTIADDHFYEVEQEVIRAALSVPGAPRNLFGLVHEMILTHVRRETDLTKWRLTRQDFEHAKQHVLQNVLETEIRRQERQLRKHEAQLADARHSKHYDLIPQIFEAVYLLTREVRGLYQLSQSILPAQARLVEIHLERINMLFSEVQGEITGVRHDITYLRQEILTTYGEGSRFVVDELIQAMQRSQMNTLHHVILAIEHGRIGEAEIERCLEPVLRVLQQVNEELVTVDGRMKEILARQDDEIRNACDLRHKLKLAVPLIPTILSYEIELENNLAESLKAIWQRLQRFARSGGQQTPSIE